jgi:hypothetical protein
MAQQWLRWCGEQEMAYRLPGRRQVFFGLLPMMMLAALARAASAQPITSPSLSLLANRNGLELRYDLDGALQSTAACVVSRELVLPHGQPIAIRLTAEDGIYELIIPELSLKADAIPGRIISLTATANQKGSFEAQLIPDGPPRDRTKRTLAVRIVTPEDYAIWERRTLRSKGCGRS